jgi:hypothetical protein
MITSLDIHHSLLFPVSVKEFKDSFFLQRYTLFIKRRRKVGTKEGKKEKSEQKVWQFHKKDVPLQPI